MGSPISSTRFSTSELPTADRFDAWRDKISVIFDVDRIGESSAAFEAQVDAYQIGNLVITDSTQGEQAYSLTPKRIRRAGIDLIQIGLYRSGGYRGEAEGKSIEGRPGDLQMLDLARPMQSVEAASEMVCVFMPREVLQERVGDLDGLHGAKPSSGLSTLLADYIALLALRLPMMQEPDGEAAANATMEMICACLRPTAATICEARSPIRDVVLLRAKRLIEENLRSPQLTPDFMCRALGVSRRSLYRLFEPLEGIHKYILRRRLEAIMRVLRNPDDHHRIADVAATYGFSCQETFWRAFKRRYGVTPGDVRCLRSPPDRTESRHPDQGFDEWLRRLHA